MQSAVEQVLSSLEFSNLQAAVAGMEYMLGTDVRTLVAQIATGESVISLEGVLESLTGQFKNALGALTSMAVQIAVPALLCALLSQLGQAFAREESARIARYACFLLMLVPLTAVMISQVNSVRDTVLEMAERMQLLFPMLLTLLSAVGGNASSAFMQPALLSASALMTQTVTNVTLRLAICAGAVTAVNHLSERMHLTRLASLCKSAAGLTMGVCFTLFIGVMTVQGVGCAVADGISLRMAKYAVDNFVPVVGGMFSDTVDLLVGCSLLVKNALGIVSLLILLALLLTPLLRLGAVVCMLRLCAALLEPVADKEVTACMDDFAGVLSLLLTTLLCVGAMFFLLIAQLLLVGNLTVMMR